MLVLRSVLLAAACSALTLSVSAAPAPISADIAARDSEDGITLERRVGGGLLKAFGKMAIGTQKGQSSRHEVKERKRKTNERIRSSVTRQRAPDHLTEGKSSSERAQLHQQHNDRLRAQAVSHAQSASKEERRKKWESAAGTSRKSRSSGGRTRPSSGDRAHVSSRLRDAGHRMQHTENIPSRHDTFHVGGHSTSGRHVRQAVGNSILYHHDQVGRGDNRNPKEFHNEPYPSTHRDSSLRGSRPIPHSSAGGRQLYEYPVTNSHVGYYGSGRPGPARVVTSHGDGRDVFHGVVGHDPSRGGDDDHYMATYRPARGSSQTSDRYSNYRYSS